VRAHPGSTAPAGAVPLPPCASPADRSPPSRLRQEPDHRRSAGTPPSSHQTRAPVQALFLPQFCTSARSPFLVEINPGLPPLVRHQPPMPLPELRPVFSRPRPQQPMHGRPSFPSDLHCPLLAAQAQEIWPWTTDPPPCPSCSAPDPSPGQQLLRCNHGNRPLAASPALLP